MRKGGHQPHHSITSSAASAQKVYILHKKPPLLELYVQSPVAHAAENSGATCCRHRAPCAAPEMPLRLLARPLPPQTHRTHPQARMARQHFDKWISTASG